MGRFTTAAKVGVFAAVMVVAGFLIWRFVNKTAASRNGYTVYVLLDDATGIAKHSQVKIAGIPVGNIDDVRLEGDKARIDIKMQPDVPLFEDAAVAK
ncbi:MAG: MlaD family protein, partial [Polyangiaceae bacterium]